MRSVLGPLLLALVLVVPAALAQEPAEKPPLRAHPVPDFKLDGEIDEWDPESAVVLGDENRIFGEDSPLSRAWSGPEDLSGEIHIGYTATDLVIAGTIHDDVLTLNPRIWWLGDEIEVFIDPDRSGGETDTHDGSDRDDYQLLLFPLGQERTWGFAVVSGTMGRSDGGFDGVRTASKRLSNDQGNFRGYTFEVAIPLVNFPRLEIGRDREIGFDLALVDADGEFVQKTYMTASGTAGLAGNPGRFGRLSFTRDLPAAEEPPGPSRAGILTPAIILLGAIAALFLLWRYRKPLNALADVPVAKKVVAISGLLALLLFAHYLPAVVERLRRSGRESDLEASALALRAILEEADGKGLLGDRETSPEPGRVLDLLAGDGASPPKRYKYRCLWVRQPNRSRTEFGTPVIDYARALSAGERARFREDRSIRAKAVSLVYHFEADPSSRRRIGPGETVAVARVLFEEGKEIELPLRWGEEVDDHDAAPHSARAAAVAWRNSEAGTHAEEWRHPIEGGARPVVQVTVEQKVEDGTFVVHGVTLFGEEDAEALPLPMISRTEAGVPTNLWRNRPAGSAARLAPGSAPFLLPLEGAPDRVWLVCAKAASRDGGLTGTAGDPMLSALRLDENGAPSEPVIFTNVHHLVPENIGEHPKGFEGELAFRWTPPGSWPAHRDLLTVTAEDGKALSSLEITFVPDRGSVTLAGATQGKLIPHRPGTALRSLVFDEATGRYTLTAGARADLEGLTLTWYHGQRAVETSFERPESVLGSSLPKGVPGAERIRIRSFGAARHMAAFLSVGEGRDDVLEASLPLPDAGSVAGIAEVVFYLCLALLLLSVLLVLADEASRFTRLRTKLTLGFAVAALVPLLLFFFGLSGLLEREVTRTESGSLLEQVELVKGSLGEMRDSVRRRARVLLEDDELRGALPPGEGEEYARDPGAIVEALAADPFPFSDSVALHVEDVFRAGDASRPRTYPASSEHHPFLGHRPPPDDLAYRWSSLVMGGVASMAVNEGRRTIAVQVPLGDDVLLDLKSRFGRRFELLLFTLRGYPYAGTLVLGGEFGGRRMADRQGIVAEVDLNRGPVVREETLAGTPYSVAYDLLRTRGGEPVALMAVALPRERFIAARAEIRNLFLVMGAVILLLEVIVGNIMTRRITGPLTSLSRGARAVAEGELETRVSVTGRDEIGTLAAAFNRMTAELGRRLGELSNLNAAIRGFSGSLERRQVLSRALAAFRQAAVPPDGVLILLDRDGAVEIATGRRDDRPIEARVREKEDGVLARALEARTPQVLPSKGPVTEEERELIGRPAAIVTVPFEPGKGAVLLLYKSDDLVLTSGDLEFFSTLAQQVGIALENARLYHLAIEDSATGIYIHSYFAARLREETDRALSAGRPLSVILVSLDDVEDIYATYGLAEGDGLMQEAARRLRTGTRGMSIMARADTSTIEVMLPEADKAAALEVAGRFRDLLTRTPRKLATQPPRTIGLLPSIGLATCPEDARSADFLLSEAHRALYKAVLDREGAQVVDIASERIAAERAGNLVFRSAEMLEIVETVDRIADSDVPILIQGETGVGKEVVAELVHERSRRAKKPLVTVNCAALPEALLESELFGYEKGAFTGADRRKPGRFELAEGGTLFLDEIGEMPPQTQVKILRVLQDHRVERLGSTSPITVDVRIIAATNRDLSAAIREGDFREDLYFRLNVVSLVIPPLRTRKEEIPDLVDHFVESYGKGHRTTGRRLGPAAMDKLFAHSWPGNVRELRNTIERALVIARAEEVQTDEIVFPEPAAPEKLEAAPRSAPARAARTPPTAPSLVNARQARLLEILSHRDSITNREYSDLVGVSVRTGNRDLLELIGMGLIVKVGRRRAAVYRLAE